MHQLCDGTGTNALAGIGQASGQKRHIGFSVAAGELLAEDQGAQVLAAALILGIDLGKDAMRALAGRVVVEGDRSSAHACTCSAGVAAAGVAGTGCGVAASAAFGSAAAGCDAAGAAVGGVLVTSPARRRRCQ
ncbi:hypothetical protein [Komagataeibacter xylinus]|uniref:hypothetical protein n=1 Tax=Komagataeibacter xylinus TaxID=28448 RepID=UPI000FDF927E|nr:hypothetical protein [Komagataeibacter xylinus]AZV38187.1 hypothetical protein CXP35_04540 [Komagataeibacter xylinus]